MTPLKKLKYLLVKPRRVTFVGGLLIAIAVSNLEYIESWSKKWA